MPEPNDPPATALPVIDVDRDPLLLNPSHRPSATVREGDYVLLHFGDGRKIFAHCIARASPQNGRTNTKNSKAVPLKINRNAYPTHNLIGLPYGTVLEQQTHRLVPLPPNDAKLIPDFAPSGGVDPDGRQGQEYGSDQPDPDGPSGGEGGATDATGDSETANVLPNKAPPAFDQTILSKKRDNRSIVDNNTSQSLQSADVDRLRAQGVTGADLVATIVEHSKTFDQKTDYSKQKYLVRKQIKYQPRCRIVRCHAATIVEALFSKDPRKIMNLRQDTLGSILSYANVAAGCQTLVWETCLGIVTGAVAQRLAGYGRIFGIYSGQQPAFVDMLKRFNLTFAENNSIKWVHSGDVLDNRTSPDSNINNNKMDDDPEDEEGDPERKERDILQWPVELQTHTRAYIEDEFTNKSSKPDDKDSASQRRLQFFQRRQARFARKLCRATPVEAVRSLRRNRVDSIIVVTEYDPTAALLALLPYLKPSCPFVVYCEFIEPLTECFRQVQEQELAINVRLSDTWMREFQVLPDRTHPTMNLPAHGGFLLTGIKLDPHAGRNELDEQVVQEIKVKLVGRRRQERQAHKQSKNRLKAAAAAAAAVSSSVVANPQPTNSQNDTKNGSRSPGADETARDSKRQRTDDAVV